MEASGRFSWRGLFGPEFYDFGRAVTAHSIVNIYLIMSTVNKFDLLAANWDAMPFVVNAAAHAAEIVGKQIEKMPNRPKLGAEVRNHHSWPATFSRIL
jgi:hypothetical protein